MSSRVSWKTGAMVWWRQLVSLLHDSCRLHRLHGVRGSALPPHAGHRFGATHIELGLAAIVLAAVRGLAAARPAGRGSMAHAHLTAVLERARRRVSRAQNLDSTAPNRKMVSGRSSDSTDKPLTCAQMVTGPSPTARVRRPQGRCQGTSCCRLLGRHPAPYPRTGQATWPGA